MNKKRKIKKYSKIIAIVCLCILFVVCVLAVLFKINFKQISTNSNVINTLQNQESIENNQVSNITVYENSIVNITNSIDNEDINNEKITETLQNNSENSNTEEIDASKNKVSEQNKDKIESSKNEAEENNKDTVETINDNLNSNKVTGDTPYFIRVNYGAQVVTIYKKDSSGYYTVPYKAMICSTGTSTPKSGIYKIPGRWNWGGLEGNVYGQYITVITGNILFHSVPYLERYNPGSLEYEEYDKLGTPASAGCVRLTVEDALWIWNNCEDGTKVEFYSSSNPGPLGKPTAKKISNAEGELKNWDPTDPDINNPWNKQ